LVAVQDKICVFYEECAECKIKVIVLLSGRVFGFTKAFL